MCNIYVIHSWIFPIPKSTFANSCWGVVLNRSRHLLRVHQHIDFVYIFTRIRSDYQQLGGTGC